MFMFMTQFKIVKIFLIILIMIIFSSSSQHTKFFFDHKIRAWPLNYRAIYTWTFWMFWPHEKKTNIMQHVHKQTKRWNRLQPAIGIKLCKRIWDSTQYFDRRTLALIRFNDMLLIRRNSLANVFFFTLSKNCWSLAKK